MPPSFRVERDLEKGGVASPRTKILRPFSDSRAPAYITTLGLSWMDNVTSKQYLRSDLPENSSELNSLHWLIFIKHLLCAGPMPGFGEMTVNESVQPLILVELPVQSVK